MFIIIIIRLFILQRLDTLLCIIIKRRFVLQNNAQLTSMMIPEFSNYNIKISLHNKNKDDITKYTVNIIRNKTEHQVLESLWKSRIIILSQILVDALRLLCKRWDSIRNKQISNVKCIEALFLSKPEDDITRCDQWIAIAQNICTNRDTINELKCLHAEKIWSNGNPMMTDPLISGSLFSSDADGLIQSVWNNSTSFVYPAFDIDVCIITFYETHNECGNVHLRAEPLNLLC
eukprot:294759_1